ncbi:MAG: hypothetical protein SPK34_02485 [Bacteroidaceae bacterium]|nr:hypothetical protein [Prevotellaceae bacterium]MDY5759806.1 hypothetical protein [Bacteroidaceae bacterium]
MRALEKQEKIRKHKKKSTPRSLSFLIFFCFFLFFQAAEGVILTPNSRSNNHTRGVRFITPSSWFQETDDTKKPARQSLAGSIPLGDDDIPKVVNRS